MSGVFRVSLYNCLYQTKKYLCMAAGDAVAAWSSIDLLASHLPSPGPCRHLLWMGQENQLAGSFLGTAQVHNKVTYLTVVATDSSCRLVEFS